MVDWHIFEVCVNHLALKPTFLAKNLILLTGLDLEKTTLIDEKRLISLIGAYSVNYDKSRVLIG
jgi:hypothetical protein